MEINASKNIFPEENYVMQTLAWIFQRFNDKINQFKGEFDQLSFWLLS